MTLSTILTFFVPAVSNFRFVLFSLFSPFFINLIFCSWMGNMEKEELFFYFWQFKKKKEEEDWLVYKWILQNLHSVYNFVDIVVSFCMD